MTPRTLASSIIVVATVLVLILVIFFPPRTECFFQTNSTKKMMIYFFGDPDGEVGREFSRQSSSPELLDLQFKVVRPEDAPMTAPKKLPALVAMDETNEVFRSEGLTSVADVEAFMTKALVAAERAMFM